MATLNLSVMLRESARDHPERAAVILDDVRLDYRQLDDAADRIATALRGLGLGRGDRVGIMLPNVPQFPVAYYGALRAGCVVVPMNVLLKSREIEYYLEDSDASALFFWQDFAEQAIAGADAAGVDHKIAVPALPADPPEGCLGFWRLVATEPQPGMAPTKPDDTAILLYTSGTTGRPKGAELTHFNLLMNCILAVRNADIRSDDVILAALPFFHAFGQTNIMNTAVYVGATLSLLPRFEPHQALALIKRDGVTVFAGVPTMYIAFLEAYEEAEWDISTIRLAVSGGAALPEQVLRDFEARFGAPILEGYGLSETSPSATFNRPDRERKVGSIGLPIWGVEVSVVDDSGARLPQGEVGEICIRGHNVMTGYHDRPDATATAIDDEGWFRTGDVGYADPDGYYFIVDRKKDLIIRGGYNVYPREIEEALYQHPAVTEAAVFGLPDATLGEEVAAAVALRPGSTDTDTEIRHWIRERVAAYKYPRRVFVRESLPKGPTGKILKRQLRDEVVPSSSS